LQTEDQNVAVQRQRMIHDDSLCVV